MKFKIGDRVRLLENRDVSTTYGFNVGDVYKITRFLKSGKHQIRIETEGGHGGFVDENQIELAESQFTKSDLRNGDVVTYRDGQTRTVECNRLINGNGDTTNYLSKYEDDLKYKIDSQKDIVKVERPVQYGVVFERKAEILDEIEKKYLGNVIRPFRDKVTGISKTENKANTKNYIIIDIKADNDLLLPDFERRNYVYWNGNK